MGWVAAYNAQGIAEVAAGIARMDYERAAIVGWWIDVAGHTGSRAWHGCACCRFRVGIEYVSQCT